MESFLGWQAGGNGGDANVVRFVESRPRAPICSWRRLQQFSKRDTGQE